MLAFEAINLFEPDIYIYSFADDDVVNLTKSASVEGSPCFSPDGKSLYITANLYASSFPRGNVSTTLYRLPLRRYNLRPFESDVYDSLFVDKDKKKSAVSVSDGKGTVDYSDVFRRLEKVDDDVRSVYTCRIGNDSWLIYSSDGKMKANKISDPYFETKDIADLKAGGRFIVSGKDLYYLHRGNLYAVDLKQYKAHKTEIEKDVEKIFMTNIDRYSMRDGL